MTVRTTEATVTFKHPFTLPSVDSPYPAGNYRLVTDEEEVHGLTFVAYRRIATMLHTPAISNCDRPNQVYLVNPVELTAALEADEQA